jgi:NADH-quinone oxidoreductase subunit J
MNLTVVLFAAIAAVTAVSAASVAISRSLIRASVWLLFTLIGVAVLYFLLGAEFLGAAQLMVYVGGTMVLLVFGVMITNEGPFAVLQTKTVEWVMGGFVAAAIFAVLVRASFQFTTLPPTDDPLPGVQLIGNTFLGLETDGKSYLLPFEIVSIHLLVVLVAAAYLARAKRRVNSEPRRPSSE